MVTVILECVPGVVNRCSEYNPNYGPYSPNGTVILDSTQPSGASTVEASTGGPSESSVNANADGSNVTETANAVGSAGPGTPRRLMASDSPGTGIKVTNSEGLNSLQLPWQRVDAGPNRVVYKADIPSSLVKKYLA